MNYTYKNKEFYFPYILLFFVVAFVSLAMAVKFPGKDNIALIVSIPIIIFGLCGLLAVFLYFVKKKYDYFPPLWTFIIPFIIILIDIIMVSLTPSPLDVNFYGVESNFISQTIYIPNEEKFFYIIQYFSLVIGIFIGVVYAPKLFSARKHLPIIIYFSYALVTVCIIASLIMEFDSYLKFFTSFKEYMSGVVLTPKSFFDHRNTWGAILLINIMGSILLYMVSKKKWAIWPMLVSFIFMVFTLSKGSLILALIALVGLLVFWFFETYKEHKTRNLIVLASVGVIILVGIILFFALRLYDLYTLSDLSLQSRAVIWKKLFYVSREMPHPLFGLGYGVAGRIILEFNNADGNCDANMFISNTHNMYLEFYAYSGIIGTLVFLFAFGYIVYISVKKWKTDKRVASFLFLAELIVFLYWMIEG